MPISGGSYSPALGHVIFLTFNEIHVRVVRPEVVQTYPLDSVCKRGKMRASCFCARTSD